MNGWVVTGLPGASPGRVYERTLCLTVENRR